MTETEYLGWFGALCNLVPIFDARAPNDWRIRHRSYRMTTWEHAASGDQILVRKEEIGWSVYLIDATRKRTSKVLPEDTYRWKAFGAVRSFFDGEPLMKADPDRSEDGLIRPSDFPH